MARGPTEMAALKKIPEVDMSLPMSMHVYGVISFMKVSSPSIYFCIMFACFSSLIWDPVRLFNWLNTGWELRGWGVKGNFL